jgi:general stress protein YciG
MAGSNSGGKKAAATNKKLHGEDFYARIGAMGGRKSTTGGFWANRSLARRAGAKGGKISRRGKAKKKTLV